MNIKIVGKNIQKIRKSRHLTQQNVADSIDINLQNLSRIERGINSPSLKTLEKIMNVLQVTPNEVLSEDFEEYHFIEKEIIQFHREEGFFKVESKHKKNDSSTLDHERERLKRYVFDYVELNEMDIMDLQQINELVFFLKQKKIIKRYYELIDSDLSGKKR